MLEMKIFNRKDELDPDLDQQFLTDFLYSHLDRFRDEKTAILKALDYALSSESGRGGFILAGRMGSKLVGLVVMNSTGMSGYIPENVLVYVAVDPEYRGRGIGRKLIEKALYEAAGDVKLHVEYDNPAKRLYERIGFINKYADMRFEK